MGLRESLSLKRKSLRYKLVIAFSLVSIIPLLVIAYFVTNYVFDNPSDIFHASAVVFFTLWLVLSGYLMLREIINPIMEIAVETKVIADGDYDSKVLVSSDDELGDIVQAVNTMRGKMRNYVGELQEYSKRTASLNVRIHKKVLTLTSLMKLGEMISSGAHFDEVTDFTAQKLASEMNDGFSAIFIKEDFSRYKLKAFVDNSGRDFSIHEVENHLNEIEALILKEEDALVVDADPLRKPYQQELRQKFNRMNAVFFPMKIKGNIVGLLILGNFAEDFKFTPEDVEVVRAFESEFILGYQNTLTAEKIQSLEIVDRLTGLYSYNYLKERLEDEINRAIFYQRPCSFIIIDVDNFEDYSIRLGEEICGKILRRVAKLLSEFRPPVGKVARFGPNEFAMLLPEMNKRESIDLAESIRLKIESLEMPEVENIKITVSIGVGENPIDGSNGEEIISKAKENVRKAKLEGMNRVVGE